MEKLTKAQKGKKEISQIIKKASRGTAYSFVQVAWTLGTKLALIGNCDIILPGIG
ncbi:hypothetical protein [Olivibacter sitiensis]|uniref:hypothetical protein n=1 Tax=Olivibacter sitiensis TaxID=376470 RepID=UPI00040E4E7B|nr:hypothetical protein [Olivibacter sitiensis]